MVASSDKKSTKKKKIQVNQNCSAKGLLRTVIELNHKNQINQISLLG